MRDWRGRFAHWTRVWGRLDELTRDCFPLEPPAASPWPPVLPCCPALAELYAACNGGTFGAYTFSPISELADPSAGWLAGLPGLELQPGRWLELGTHYHGHALLWDSVADEVVLYSPDDGSPRRSGRTVEEFLTRLFHPSKKASAETAQLWAAALSEADGLS